MRIAFHIALILSLLYLPWWVGAIILVCACFLLERFYEAVLYGILTDALYGTGFGSHGFEYMATAFSVALILSASFMRSRFVW